MLQHIHCTIPQYFAQELFCEGVGVYTKEERVETLRRVFSFASILLYLVKTNFLISV